MQVLIDDARYDSLRERAHRTGTSVGALVREAIDRAYFVDEAQRRAEAGESFLRARPMELPEWGELEQEIERSYERRAGA